MSKNLTVKELGNILFEEFERDQWGDIDPYYFKNPSKEDGEMSTYEVLDRVVKRINQKFNPKKFTQANYKWKLRQSFY